MGRGVLCESCHESRAGCRHWRRVLCESCHISSLLFFALPAQSPNRRCSLVRLAIKVERWFVSTLRRTFSSAELGSDESVPRRLILLSRALARYLALSEAV